MKKLIPLLFAMAIISNAKEAGSNFLHQVHAQVGFGTSELSSTVKRNSDGFYFARFEAPIFLDNLIISLEPRRAASENANHDIRWSGAVAYRIF